MSEKKHTKDGWHNHGREIHAEFHSAVEGALHYAVAETLVHEASSKKAAELRAARIVADHNALRSLNPEAVGKVVEALEAYIQAYPHNAPNDCFATGPLTGDPLQDNLMCPGCIADSKARAALRDLKEVKS